DYIKAKICYEQSIEKNPKSSNSLYSLGVIHQYCLGVNINLNTAKDYYKKAARVGSYFAKVNLLKIYNPSMTADQWNDLGEKYYEGIGKSKDYVKARACYEEAFKLNPNHQRALYSLGWLYEHGEGVKR